MLFKILVIFMFMLTGIRFKIHLGLIFIACAVILIYWTGFNHELIIRILTSDILTFSNFSILMIVVFIIIQSNIMQDTGNHRKIVEIYSSFRNRFKSSIIIPPALIGLLPMPGGAIFSAPMVKTLSYDLNISDNKKAVINYYFRHIWEYWLPFYPAVLLAVSIADISLLKFIIIMFPFTIISVIAGYFFLLKNISAPREDEGTAEKSIMKLIKISSPVWVIIVLVLVLTLLFKLFDLPVKQYKGIETFTAMFLGVIYTIIYNKAGFKHIKNAVFSSNLFNTVVLVCTVIFFKETVESTGTVSALIHEFNMLNIPPFSVIIILPFITGILTGIAFGFVGSSFPLVIPLIQNSYPDPLPYIMLAFFSGYIGLLLSPVHVCLILTKNFFNTTYTAMIKDCYRNYLVLIIFAFVWFLIL